MRKYADVNVGTLRTIIKNIKEALSAHKSDLESVKNNMGDNNSWKCTAKNTLLEKLGEFPIKNHDTLEPDYERAETIFVLLEQVQELYRQYDAYEEELNDLRSELSTITKPGYNPGDGAILEDQISRISNELGRLYIKMDGIKRDAEKIESQIENA